MQVAQSLYENGHITYMRTDSTNLASVAIEAARELVASQYGGEYLARRSRGVYADQGQERPGSARSDSPGRPSVRLSRAAARRAERRRVQALRPDLEADRRQPDGRRPRPADHDHHRRRTARVFQVGGKTIDFPGYLRAYVEGSDDPQAELADKKRCCPASRSGETLDCRELEPKSHTTQPPARFSEATLTRALEEMGIGRPSTYASIIDTILAREYVFKKGNALVPTWVGVRRGAIARSASAEPGRLSLHGPDGRRPRRDQPRRGGARRLPARASTSATARPGSKQQLARQGRRDRRPRHQPHPDRHSPKGSEPIFVRVGRYGPFLEQGERRASIPDETAARRSDARDARWNCSSQAAAGRRAAGHLPRDAASRSI